MKYLLALALIFPFSAAAASHTQIDVNSGVQRQIDALEKHAAVANEEMADIQKNLAIATTDITWMKSSLNSIDTRLWALMALALSSIVIPTFLHLRKK